jgi:hypothetical protein
MQRRSLCWLGWHQWIRHTHEGEVCAEFARCKTRNCENWQSLTR